MIVMKQCLTQLFKCFVTFYACCFLFLFYKHNVLNEKCIFWLVHIYTQGKCCIKHLFSSNRTFSEMKKRMLPMYTGSVLEESVMLILMANIVTILLFIPISCSFRLLSWQWRVPEEGFWYFSQASSETLFYTNFIKKHNLVQYRYTGSIQ